MNSNLKDLISYEKNLGNNPLHNYPTSLLKEIDEYLKKEDNIEKLDKLMKDVSASYYEIGDTSGSISLRYIIGRLNQILKPHEAQTRLSNLINDFHDKGNKDASLYASNVLLETNEDVAALSVLAENEKSEEVWKYYERIVKVDLKNVDLLSKIAEHYKEEGNNSRAILSLQKAFTRAIKNVINGNESVKYQIESKNILSKLLCEEGIDYSYYIQILKDIDKDKYSSFVIELFNILNDDIQKKVSSTSDDNPNLKRKYLDILINNIGYMLSFDDRLNLRMCLVDALKSRYSQSPRYSQLMGKFNWNSMRQNICEMLSEFLENIAYAKGVFVLQKSTNKVGIINDISPEGEMEIVFSNVNKDIAHIKVENALGHTVPLSSRDIRAIKRGKKSEDIKKKIFSEGGDEWLLKTMLFSSDDNKGKFDDMKKFVSPSILNEDEWKSIKKKMEKIAENDPYIDNLDKGEMELLDYPKSKEDRAYTTFKIKDDDKKISLFLSLVNDDEVDLSNKNIQEMVNTLGRMTKERGNDISFKALFALEKVSKDALYPESSFSFLEMYSALSKKEKTIIYGKLTLKDKENFIHHIKEEIDSPFVEIKSLFLDSPSDHLKNELLEISEKEYSSLINEIIENPKKENVSAFIYILDLIYSNKKDKYLKKIDVLSPSFIESELGCLSYVLQNNGKPDDVRTIGSHLKENEKLKTYITSAPLDNIKSYVLPIVEEGSAFSDKEKKEYEELIFNRFPLLFSKKEDNNEKETEETLLVRRGFLCTKASFENKSKEIEDIKNVQIPKVDREIKDARSLGDLRENAEYQYAKEHKGNLDRNLDTLSLELRSVYVMSKGDVLKDRVGFGTKVRLEDLDEKREIVYTFLGRWESKPEENILDINAPLSLSLLDKKVGEKAEFKNGSVVKHFLVKDIQIIDF